MIQVPLFDSKTQVDTRHPCLQRCAGNVIHLIQLQCHVTTFSTVGNGGCHLKAFHFQKPFPVSSWLTFILIIYIQSFLKLKNVCILLFYTQKM